MKSRFSCQPGYVRYLAAPLDKTARQELRTALAHFNVLFFRQQKLDARQQVEIASISGIADGGKAYFPTSAENPIVEVLETKPGGPRYTTDQWHQDLSYLADLPAGAMKVLLMYSEPLSLRMTCGFPAIQ